MLPVETDEFPSLDDLLSYDVDDEAREARRRHEEQLKVNNLPRCPHVALALVCWKFGALVGSRWGRTADVLQQGRC